MEKEPLFDKIKAWFTPEVISAVSGVVVALFGLIAAIQAAQAAEAKFKLLREQKALDKPQ